jgi:hypothetical protein
MHAAAWHAPPLDDTPTCVGSQSFDLRGVRLLSTFGDHCPALEKYKEHGDRHERHHPRPTEGLIGRYPTRHDLYEETGGYPACCIYEEVKEASDVPVRSVHDVGCSRSVRRRVIRTVAPFLTATLTTTFSTTLSTPIVLTTLTFYHVLLRGHEGCHVRRRFIALTQSFTLYHIPYPLVDEFDYIFEDGECSCYAPEQHRQQQKNRYEL